MIRAAYRVLAQKHHPDRNQDSFRHELVLAALNKAQDVLLDPERRAAHDQWIRQEEIRLGLREPSEESKPGLGLRTEPADPGGDVGRAGRLGAADAVTLKSPRLRQRAAGSGNGSSLPKRARRMLKKARTLRTFASARSNRAVSAS